ncbi:efflux RND transporter periplasmic adaptor subunit [Belnapia rosea]|uniref:efflux RND transporter periplasmic adaptor subunit n=1 Tax=Belnapia rosea TaxID=938405 RepID=UPI00088CC24C|nr:efflux RND transporter periplasmic adaptor subunit [Belnapia rosea]SDB71680.1 membrane fusion protein, cobalt-zinc-cadmium efflux system [Belnapia rosea]
MNTTRFTTLAGLATSALLVGAVAGVGIRPVDAALHALWTRSPAAAAAGERASAETRREGGGEEHAEGELHLTAEQIEAAGIQLAEIGGGTIARHVTVPGTVTASADRLARVPARVAGTVTELRRRLGDQVAAGDVLAVVESREIAEAKASYLAALRTEALARTTFERERRLWERKISAEQDFLKARTDAEEARIQLDLSRARLSALGLGTQEITALPGQPTDALRRQEVRATLAGRVTDRRIDVGASVAPETEAFAVADLSAVWVEMTISAGDLAFVREGQAVSVTGTGVEQPREGRIIFVSPVLDTQTRTARAVAELPNPDTVWRPGAFVAAAIATEEQPVERRVPLEALQTVEAETVVFVRTEDGFEKRKVTVGRRDERAAEVLSGVEPGEQVAATGSFVLKAELGKSDAEHEE